MARFKIIYTVGKSIREDNIVADTIEDAEIKADQRHPTWIDIIDIATRKEN